MRACESQRAYAQKPPENPASVRDERNSSQDRELVPTARRPPGGLARFCPRRVQIAFRNKSCRGLSDFILGEHMTITESTPIGDIAAAIPSSVRIFQRHGIDFCCGGKRALGTVCTERGLPFAATVSAIETSAASNATDRDWTHEPLASLIDHIVATYHDPLREEMPRLQEMAARVAQVHGRKAVHLTRLLEIVDALAADLLAHMRTEERVLFPAIRAIESGRASDVAWITAPVSAMQHEHDWAGALLDDLRELTGNYTLPDSACATMRALYQGLEELERAMHVHVHLENNVLFPRAVHLEAAAVSR